MANLTNFEKTNFSFHGIYRGLVEDNADPEDAGRLRVRIREIHSEDGKDIPVNQLPWAEPALGLYWSGGRNITNKDHDVDNEGNGDPDSPNVERYNPNPPAKTPNNEIPKPVNYPTEGKKPEERITYDDFGNACGTGGIYTTPKRGNWVFLFFENGNHMKPIYFAMAPNKRDWDYQKAWRNGEIDQKIGQLQEFQKDFSGQENGLTEPRKEITGSDWAQKAKVDARVIEPKIFNINLTKDIPDSNRDVTCITSLNGTSIIIDNRLNNEQIYVIHKNYLEFTDKFGNRTEYVGKQRNLSPNLEVNEKPQTNDPDESTNYNLGVEGNHYLHILGNYDVFTHGRMHIQCDEHVQIDAQKSVGVVSREGDIDIIAEKGNVNIDVAEGYVDAHINKNLNAHIEGNANIKIDGDMKSTVSGNTHLKTDHLFIQSNNMDMDISSNLKINASTVDINANDIKTDANLHVGGNTKIKGTCDIRGTVKLASDLNVDRGISCGGYLRNKGEANLGAPVIAHQLQVQSGMGTGQGKGATNPQTPSQADSAQEANQETGNEITKNFSETDPKEFETN